MITGVATINGMTEQLAAALWRASWQGAVALAVAWVLTRCIARMPAALKCWVWRPAYLKVLAALVWASPVLLPLLPPMPVQNVPILHVSAESEPAAPSPQIRIQATPPPAAAALDRLTATMTLWSIGVSVGLVRLGLGWRAARTLRRRCTPLHDPSLAAACEALSRRLGMRRAPALATVASNTIRTPLLLGPLRPLVVLPADATARHSPAELRLMLAHELAHLRRGDLWWNWLPAAAQTLLFFHPLVWLAAREWRLAQESACDEAAVAAAGASPARYGDMLLAVLSAPSANRSVFKSLPATAAAGVAESLSTLQRRLTAMKHFPAAPCRTRVRRAFACAFFVIGCTAIAPWSVVARQPDPANAGRGDHEAATSPGPAEAAQPDAEPVPAGAPAPAGTTSPGYLSSAEANLAAASEGIVTQVGAEVGQSVKKGQLIVKLNDRKAQLALQAAKAKLAEVNATARRVKELYEAKQLSEAELERTAAEREQAQVELALREQDLEEMRVVSPLDGAVEKLSVRPGEYVARGGEVARVVALDAFWADVNVATDTAAGIKPGDPAAVQLGRRHGWSLKGRVRFVSSVVRSGSQSTLVRVDVLDPPPGLKPGMEVVVEFGGGK